MIKRWVFFLATVVLLAGSVLGCGGSKDKGINSDMDRPRPDTAPKGPR